MFLVNLRIFAKYSETFCIMTRNVYVLITDLDVVCYTNLSKLVRQNPKVNYYSTYRGLRVSNKVEKDGIIVIKTRLI